MNNKFLYNQKNKKDLINQIDHEDFKRVTVSFYKYIHLEKLENLRDQLFLDWDKLNILGRVYIANEGINAQISVPEKHIIQFKNYIHSHENLKKISIKPAVQEGRSFLKLTIKIKKEIVAYGIKKSDYNIKKVGNHLNYKQFNKAIDDGAIIIDMRNYYEGEIGKFKNAIIPDVDRSKNLLPEVRKLLKNHENSKILMYCTGGIRCEKASSYLLHHGYKDVNQLCGGIVQYAHDIKKNNVKSKFIGKNFVFDYRMGERITEDILSVCHICEDECDMHTNCLNQACHILMIQCEKCKKKYDNCCSKKCTDFIKFPIEKQKELFKSGAIKFNAQKSKDIKPKLYQL